MTDATRRFRKLRELLTLSRDLRREGLKLARGSQARADRLNEAEEYRIKALWLVGRIDDEALAAYQREQLDAKAYPLM